METLLFILYTLQAIFLGALFGRIDGGGVYKWNEQVERLAIMSYFVFACIPTAGSLSILALLGTFGIATGHGQYFLAIMLQKCKPEFFDFIVTLFYGKDPRTLNSYINGTPVQDKVKLYYRCLLGMCVTGSLVGLPAAIICILTGNIYGLALLLTGPAKAFSYFICDKLGYSTENAEYLNGALRTLLTCIALFGGLKCNT